MSDVKRRQVQAAILKWMYDWILESPATWALPEEGDIEGFDFKDVQYELRRLDGDGFLEGDHYKKITARGMEYLQDLGGDTVLGGDLRQRILAALYEKDREEGPHARSSGQSLAESLSESANVIGAALYYLKDSGLIDLQSVSGSYFRSVRINPRGMAKHEALQSSSGDWAASTTSPTDGHEFVFGPDEEAEADRLLRDVTEVARTEILVVDPYARAGIVAKLQNVPSGVNVKVLTSDRMAKEDYASALQAYPRLGIKIRALPSNALEFHDRYIIVDGNDAWAWGHSFHDAGKTKHTVAQIRPVNRDLVSRDFQQKWPTAKVLL